MRFELQIAGVVSSAVRFHGGTIFFVDLQLTLKGQNSNESRDEPSERGDFPRVLSGSITVKDSNYNPGTDDEGHCSFQQYELNVKMASVRPRSVCAICHPGECKKKRRGAVTLSNVKQLEPSATVSDSPGLGIIS